MRALHIAVLLFLAVFVPKLGTAQVYTLPAPPPDVTAADTGTLAVGEPVYYAGDYYFPTGPTVFFDGNVMVRSGVYKNVPLYVDTTISPYSIVYVPVGGRLMRPYERRRAGELAGTVGSRMPSFPIERDVEVSAASGAIGIQTPPIGQPSAPPPIAQPAVVPPSAGTVGTFSATGTFTATTATGSATLIPVAPESGARGVETIPSPRSNEGIWVEFNGARWYSAGPAIPFAADRFNPVGEYHGFPVYRERGGQSNEVWIPAVKDGPVVPYKR